MADPDLDGVLVIDKAKGPTSHDVVASLRRILQLRRIGHCGTLDPLASGVLVMCLGRYTRLNKWLSNVDKDYEATICLGATSETGDAQGPIRQESGFVTPVIDDITNQLQDFCGEIDQVPPAYSAVKVGGVRSYKRARRGEDVELQARRIKIHSIELLRYNFPQLLVRISCSSGTYIRSLAADLGSALGTGAYLADLRRLRVGCLGLDMALTLDEVVDHTLTDSLDEVLAHPKQALNGLAKVELSADKLIDFTHGKSVEHPLISGGEDRDCAVFDSGATLFGIAKWEKGLLRPFCVLQQPPLVAS